MNKSLIFHHRHMIATFEAAIALMPPGVEQWSWVLDFHGFALRDCDPRLARIFLTLAAAHYPERLGYFFIVDPPALFSTFWSAVSRFIDPKTKSKIAFLSLKKRAALMDEFEKHVDASTAEWLVAEMEENREKGRGGVKHYGYDALADLMEGKQPELGEGHIHLGAPGFLKTAAAWAGPAPPQFRCMAPPRERK